MAGFFFGSGRTTLETIGEILALCRVLHRVMEGLGSPREHKQAVNIKLLVIFVALVSTSVAAQVYKRVDSQGNVTYSDQPVPGSKPVKLPEIQTYTPTPTRSKNESNVNVEGATKIDGPEPMPNYAVSVASPGDDATVINNEGTVPLSVNVQPPLRKTEKVVITFDGQPIGPASSSTTATMTFVDRGSHSVGARVVDAGGNTVASARPITFFLRRQFIKTPRVPTQ